MSFKKGGDKCHTNKHYIDIPVSCLIKYILTLSLVLVLQNGPIRTLYVLDMTF